MVNHHTIQLASLILSIVGIVAWVLWGKRGSTRWLYIIPPISWLLHVVVYYGIVLGRVVLKIPLEGWFMDWSTIIKLHGVILIFAIGSILLIADIIRPGRTSWIHRLLF